MKRSLTTLGVLGLVGAGVLLSGGTASAAPAPRPAAAVCNAAVLTRDMPPTWLPRSSRERGKRLRWAQVSRWDTDRNGQLSDREVLAFQNSRVQVPGGPNCAMPVPQSPPPPNVGPRR